MQDSTIYDWIKDGFTLVPNKLFNDYHRLNISSDEMILIIFMMCQINQGQSLEDISLTSKHLGWSQSKLHEVLNSLMNQGFLEIELIENDQGKKMDHYTLRPLFEKLDEEHYQKISVSESPTTQEKERSLVAIFEDEFGRTLSQIELETLFTWTQKEGYSEDLIYLALKQAVLNGALSLKYIDRILLNWTKNNIHTVEAAQREIERFEAQRTSRFDSDRRIPEDDPYKHISIPLDYWKHE